MGYWWRKDWLAQGSQWAVNEIMRPDVCKHNHCIGFGVSSLWGKDWNGFKEANSSDQQKFGHQEKLGSVYQRDKGKETVNQKLRVPIKKLRFKNGS